MKAWASGTASQGSLSTGEVAGEKKGGGGEDLKKKFVRPNLIFGCGEGRGRRVLSPWAYYTAAQSLQCLIRVCFSTNCFHFEVPDETCLKDMQLYM